ncbi:MAG: bacterial regulatory s, gntR family protein [Rhodoferax sp.]|nr:bacterial regulatory s, gntR family protein [Rhodoferax sp.]
MPPSSDIGLIDVPKSCDMLAARLRNQILSGVYLAGAQLPSERELVEQTGISRNAVREGLRILEAEGLVQTRLGRYGGSFVCQPSDEMFSRYLRIYSASHNISLQSLVEARQALEPQVAMLAASNRTDADLTALRRSLTELEQADEPAPFLEKNMQWHHVVADASQNKLLKVFLTSLSRLINNVSGVEEFASANVRKETGHVYGRILQAIQEQDVAAAGRRMTRHVQAYSQQAASAHLKLNRNR